MTIRINPLDTFFFRDGKPFTMGSETWTDSLFPPSPSVFYGALRSCWLLNQKEGFSKDNIRDSESLKIKGIFLEIGGAVFLPVPKDFLQEKVKKSNRHTVVLGELSSVVSNKPINQVATKKDDIIVEEIEGNALFEDTQYENYLDKHDIENLQYKPAKDYIVKESKIGISRNIDTHTTEEGLLYRVDFNRFDTTKSDIAFVIDFEGLDFPQQGTLRLGGEAKLAAYELINTTEIKAPNVSSQSRFKLCLATPTILENGWLPKWINKDTLIGEFGIDVKIQVKLITAIIGKPISIGGFDIDKREPKLMYKAVPAGSVYQFELLKGSMEDAIKLFHGQAFSDEHLNEHTKQGFGLTYIGKI